MFNFAELIFSLSRQASLALRDTQINNAMLNLWQKQNLRSKTLRQHILMKIHSL